MSYRGQTKPAGFADARVWECSKKDTEWRVTCKLCRTKDQSVYNAKRHADTSEKHKEKLSKLSSGADAAESSSGGPTPAVPFTSAFDVITTRFIQGFAPADAPVEPLPPLDAFPDYFPSESPPPIDWSELDNLAPVFNGSRQAEEIQALTSYMLNTYQYGPDNVSSDEESADEYSNPPESDAESDNGADEHEPDPLEGLAEKRPRLNPFADTEAAEWFPWPNRTACSIDILLHLPRSVFSDRQLEMFLWILRLNGAQDVTSVKTTKELDARLQKLYGIQTLKYRGALGHTYYVNSVADIIAQEMSNPCVRDKLSFYPEDGGQNSTDACHFSRWSHEIPDEELGPMARFKNGTDYYIFEPAMLRNGTICMPHRWFKRGAHFVARCWEMEEVLRGVTQKSWRVVKGRRELEVSEQEFLKSFPQITRDAALYPHVCDICNIEDYIDYSSSPPTVEKWTQTNPVLGNPWRERANGAECLVFPIWLYCDDTSGNTSKKWNKHNSFLFTPAGLPRSESSKEYNIHFLATSNIAPPLEMLDGIADQINDSQEHGVWAWDASTEKMVLLIICVLALLGDNPMQSEFCSHIGLRGKLFCRVCKVKGKDAAASDSSGKPLNIPDEDEISDTDSDAGSAASVGSADSQAPKTKGKRRKFKEGLAAMVQRVKNFVKPGIPRTKNETVQHLRSQFIQAKTPAAAARIRAMRTETGVKDTYQNFFVERLLSSYKKRRGVSETQTALNEAISNLPAETMSPVWRIRGKWLKIFTLIVANYRLLGLDPHSDTPVEILHIILLGFVKYLWRDVIANQIKKNTQKKAELIVRVESVNIDGLSIDGKLSDVLVNHYGSLTGSDFRKISQVAPFILKGLVPNDCYETWVAVSKMIPLIWQNEIADLDVYVATVKREIQYFLACVGRWTIRWFNKPKFHIILHLPDHIRRFGPAMLFATEAFESYNAVIRAKSVHSNRQAPSRDIAYSFARQSRIRHMLSGGAFLDRSQIVSDVKGDELFEDVSLAQKYRVTQVQRYFRNGMYSRKHWVVIGPQAQRVLPQSECVARNLGLSPTKKLYTPGTCTLDRSSTEKRWANTMTGRRAPLCTLYTETDKKTGSFLIAKDIRLVNGDKGFVGSFVACRGTLHGRDGVAIGQVKEILCRKNTTNFCRTADSVLVEIFSVGPTVSCHGMPRLASQIQFALWPPLIEKIAPIRQEREQTEQRKGRFVHKGNLDDIVLNTAQMRDAKYLQRFRAAPPDLPIERILEESATREWNIQNKRRQPATASTSPTRSPTTILPSASAAPSSLSFPPHWSLGYPASNTLRNTSRTTSPLAPGAYMPSGAEYSLYPPHPLPHQGSSLLTGWSSTHQTGSTSLLNPHLFRNQASPHHPGHPSYYSSQPSLQPHQQQAFFGSSAFNKN